MRSVLWFFVLCGVASASGWKAMLAPGPVVSAHEDQAGNCDACHSAFDGIPNERCLACHDSIESRQSSGDGWHASVADQPCITCHTDHRGADAKGTRDAALAEFDHSVTDFPLTGGHAINDCDTCHGDSLTAETPGCASCHTEDDPHESALGATCDSCHVATTWTAGLKSIADHALAMHGGHDGLECADCHAYGEHLATSTVCNDCHEDGHGGTTFPCSDCHEPHGWTPAEFDHGPCTCAFPGKHQTVGCLDCHAEFVFTNTPTQCGGCHEPEGAHEPLGECAGCHNALSWSDHQFDHSRTNFPLDGAHLAVSCDMCHTEAGVFTGQPTTCEGCHDTAPHPDFGTCAKCHAPSSFAESSFDHASTGFALSGRHGELPCASCHAPDAAD